MSGWTAIVPIKSWRSGKSRVSMPSDAREELARALTLDTLDVLTAHLDIDQVVVVTVDSHVREEARFRGATVLTESEGGLNDAIRQARDWAANQGDGPTVVVPADLAYLSAEVLAAALAALAQARKAHIPDLAGTGTTLLAAPSASSIDPHYGVDSSALHAAAGFRRIDDVDPRARADIDQLSDLNAEWEPGPRVSALVVSARPAPEAGSRAPQRGPAGAA